MYEAFLELDQVRINFSTSGSHVLNIILGFIMFGVALDIRPREFKEIIKKPKALIGGLLAQMFLLPAVTFLIVLLFHKVLTPTVAMGMILVAACPGGNISNFICNYAKGKIELSVTMTAMTTVAAILTTPFNFAFWGDIYMNYLAKHAANELLPNLTIDPVQMFHTVFILLGIPLALGMSFAHLFPTLSKKIAPWFQRFSILMFAAMIVIAFSNNLDIFLNYIGYIALIVLVHNASAFATGYLTGTAFRVTPKERRAISIEVGIQNSGLGLALLFNPKIFSPDLAIGGMLLIAAWWGIWHIVAGLILGTFWHRRPIEEIE
ncbi:MAG: bile acid:sodium symporter family protein [Bacteroidales bacterium]|nr:bile acid:sodium symporter family protein [Bacteroidales bacterium]MDD4712664.1 bile acid:sodium symporter family protein [Bacteroidales bacterium]